MNSSKRKSRPAGLSRYSNDSRQSKGKSVQAQGVYNNTYFMHAATALVGNIVQVHLRSGNVYEGVFRTFSPNFDVALELPFCIKSNINALDEGKPVPNCMIFTSDNVVSIVAKEFDPNYATGGAFQTDTAISEKFISRLDEKELEPWDPTGMNGELEFELDGGANGWDANEMFIKNEKAFGVQSTFDDSLSDYTVQIEKRETDEFKEAEAKAEKLAQEIEKNPICRERLDLENGDEESLYAAVERPPEQNREECNMNNKNNVTNAQPRNQIPSLITTVNSSPHSLLTTQRTIIPDKYIQMPVKRKGVQTNSKLVRPSIGSNTCTNVSQSNTTSNTKLTNYQTVQIQGTASFAINQGFSPLIAGSASFRHQGNPPQSKLNGDVPNISVKNASQRVVRSYATQCYVEYNPQQMPISKSVLPSHNQNCAVGSAQDSNNSPPLLNHMGQQAQTNMQVGNQPPLPQRQLRGREDQIQDLRKFQQDFHLSGINPQSTQHPMPININKNANISTHQVQQSVSPPQSQNVQQHASHTASIHNHTQLMQSAQIHHLNMKQTDSSSISQPSKSTQFSQPQDKPIYQNHTQPVGKQASPVISPGINLNDSAILNNSTSSSSTNNVNSSFNSTPTNKSTTDNQSVEKTTPKTTITKKTHVLNPSAKPFTPRSPSTPNPSRPHTPQTPVQSVSGMYSAGSHVGNSQTSFYLMQPQQHSHPNPVQQPRLRRGPVAASQMHVSAAAATGQPLLTAAPLQQFIHYQQAPHPPHFPSQQYQPMMRMFHEPPPQSIQFLAQTPPSTTPSPGQPHQQFHPPPQPSPAGGGPQTAFGTTAQPYHVMCPVIHPQLVPNYYQGTPQNPHTQYQIIMPQHPAQ